MKEDLRTIGFLITALATSPKDPAQAIRSAMLLKDQGNEVEIFLIGDGVYLIRPGQEGAAPEALAKALQKGIKVLVSEDHLMAAGLHKAPLPEGAVMASNPAKQVVLKTMEEWARVLVC
jgi:predicted peroxiredoxin